MKIVSNITRKEAGECISRQCVLDKIQRLIDAERNNIDENGDYMNYARERVNAYEAIQFFVENDCLCPSVTPQEPFKPMVEIDLDYVIKQKYIEREVLDKIRAEIEQKCCITVGRENDSAITLYDVLQIIDKYKGESENP